MAEDNNEQSDNNIIDFEQYKQKKKIIKKDPNHIDTSRHPSRRVSRDSSWNLSDAWLRKVVDPTWGDDTPPGGIPRPYLGPGPRPRYPRGGGDGGSKVPRRPRKPRPTLSGSAEVPFDQDK